MKIYFYYLFNNLFIQRKLPQKFPLIFCPPLNILLHLDYYFYNKFNRHKWKHKILSQ